MSELLGYLAHRNLALEAVRITEATALAASAWMGRGDEVAVDGAAARAMCDATNILDIDGTVVIGEFGEGRQTDLCPGRKLGSGAGPAMDMALTPLEGITACARGGANCMSVLALTDRGGFLSVPEIYMDKIAVGPGLPEDVVDLDADPETNLKSLASAKGVAVSDLLVSILDRPRHERLIAQIRDAGARIMLFPDGDVCGVLATLEPSCAVDMFVGVGGAPQGVLAAAAVVCAGGRMQARLAVRNAAEAERVRQCGLEDPEAKLSATAMAKGDVMFAATGVTRGALLRGVRRGEGWMQSHSVVMHAASGTVRFLESRHRHDTVAGLVAAP